MRFRRRVAANGTKVPPLPSPRAAPALTPIFALAPILARAPIPNPPIPNPARRCCHRPSSASPLASDAERPPASTLATSPPLRPSALAFPSRLPISPPISPPTSRLSRPRLPVMCACPSCSPSCFCSGARPPGRPVSDPSALAHHGVFGPRPEPHKSWETSGDLGDLAPQPAASCPLKRSLSSRLLRDSWRVGTVPIPTTLCLCLCVCSVYPSGHWPQSRSV